MSIGEMALKLGVTEEDVYNRIKALRYNIKRLPKLRDEAPAQSCLSDLMPNTLKLIIPAEEWDGDTGIDKLLAESVNFDDKPFMPIRYGNRRKSTRRKRQR